MNIEYRIMITSVIRILHKSVKSNYIGLSKQSYNWVCFYGTASKRTNSSTCISILGKYVFQKIGACEKIINIKGGGSLSEFEKCE